MTFLPQTVRGAAVASLLLLVAAALPLASCGGGSSPTAAATPAPEIKTETFTGTLAQGGTAAFPFTVVAQGSITATLTTFSPQTTITVGFGIGQPASGTCTLISGAYSESAKTGYALNGTIAAGTYCVLLYDIGNVSSVNDFLITVAHP